MANEPARDFSGFHKRMEEEGFRLVDHNEGDLPFEDKEKLKEDLLRKGIQGFKSSHYHAFFAPYPEELQKRIEQLQAIPKEADEYERRMVTKATELAIRSDILQENELAIVHASMTVVDPKTNQHGSIICVRQVRVFSSTGPHGNLSN